MKVLAISGSPRDGNTDAMLKKVLDGAKSKGANIELVKLREKKIGFCDGQSECEKTKSCHFADDMQAICGKIFDVDVIVLGSPNYFNNVSGLMKNFIDRMNPYWDSPKLKEKKVVIVSVGGQERDSIKYCEQALEQFAKICSMGVVGKLWAQADKAGEVRQNAEKMQKCFSLGENLASS